MIAYGKGGEIASNRRDEQEMFVLCLRILQSVLVYVNTLMLQDILGEPEWADLLTDADRRGLTPLFWPRTPVRRGESRHGGPSEPHRNYGAGRPGTDQPCWLGCGEKTVTDPVQAVAIGKPRRRGFFGGRGRCWLSGRRGHAPLSPCRRS
ncbi:Tn3 family transposase [Streptomyces sp. NPDC005706]|uniref:Tn3 family transposase n=1 Tax=Streptomyces sp. NPDC005706 TaxID=3157169 RepID=UPI0033FEDB55